MKKLLYGCSLGALLAVAGCGGGSTPPVDDDSGPGDTGPRDAGPPMGDGGRDAAASDSGSDAGPTCTSSQMLCGGSCVDTQTDVTHCGDCATACGTGEVCVAGSCQTDCPTGQDACGGSCFNLQTDRANCGMCGRDCASGEVCSLGTCGLSCAGSLTTCDPGGGVDPYCADTTNDRANCGTCGHACDPGYVCNGSSCELSCAAGEDVCGSSCVDFDTDRANCGTCGHACADGEVCSGGTCGLSCGGTSPTLCGTSCTDTQTDRANCGTCGHACADGEVCSGGTCGLSCGGASPTLCSGACVNLDTDRDHCGMCGHACATGEVCTSGVCGLSCGGATPTLCGTSCVDTTTSRFNCGTCGHACATGEVCTGGTCGLSCGGATPTLCGTSCVDTDTNRSNCGMCGRACLSGEVCSGGSCSLSCGGTTPTACGTACVDTMTDLANCGTCGHACGAGELCSAGACAPSCASPLTECSGACVNTSTDPNNCGVCGDVCATGEACLGGFCAVTFVRYPTSCYELHITRPAAASGAYQIDPDGPMNGVDPYMVYCDMTNDGGGWTLFLKADGTQTTFQYDQATWTDTTVLNTSSTDMSSTEAKFASFSNMPFSALRIQALTGGTTTSLVAEANATSLRSAIASGFTPTSLGTSAWVGLFPGGGVQPFCNREGIGNAFGAPFARARIGLVSNQENDCGSPDSTAGVGIQIGEGNGCYGTPNPTISVGIIGGGGCGPDGPDVTSFAFVFGRRLPASCAEIHGWSGSLADGMYTIDPDGAGGVAPFSAYCDMRNGGWTMVMATNGIGPDGQAESMSVAPSSGSHLPPSVAMALAAISTQVNIRTAGLYSSESISSVPSSLAIMNLRNGYLLNNGSPLSSSTDDPSALWTGPFATDSRYLWHTCGLPPWGGSPGSYPNIYWACNNGGGLHITGTGSLWNIGTGTPLNMEVYVR